MSVFYLKKFAVAQDECAMKVGTDSTILGAWANAEKADRILDIGSGTGVLALMMAQKNTDAEITAIEIDEAAYLQAKGNFKNSPWSERLQLFHCPVQEFKSPTLFDVIISNPPFYQSGKHIAAPDEKRRIARSTETLSFDDLAAAVSALLSPEGIFYLILPTENETAFVEAAQVEKLYIIKRTLVYPRIGKAANRVLMGFSKNELTLEQRGITIRNDSSEAHNYTIEFKELLRDFMIIF